MRVATVSKQISIIRSSLRPGTRRNKSLAAKVARRQGAKDDAIKVSSVRFANQREGREEERKEGKKEAADARDSLLLSPIPPRATMSQHVSTMSINFSSTFSLPLELINKTQLINNPAIYNSMEKKNSRGILI